MKQTKHVLMVLGSYDQSAHEGIAQFAVQQQWHLNVSILKDFQLPEHWQGDGIITSLNNSQPLVDFVTKANVPTVDLSSWREDIDLPRVVADNPAIGRLGAEHFIEMGHQHCAWFALASNPVSQARYDAYSQRLDEAGIQCIRLDKTRPQDGAYITKQLKALPKPCAIYTKSDYDSAWISSLCLSADIKVPDDIAILGADDNTLICENQVIPLSSVRHDLRKIGYEGAALLNQLMQGQSPKQRVQLIPPKGITIRQSTNRLAVMDSLIREVLTYLSTNFRRSIGTDELAEHFQLSRCSLEGRFRSNMHCSIREHLIRIRLKEAINQLQFTDETIETIAAMTGFCHASHFSNTFKKHYKQSPKQFRNQTKLNESARP
ncbi:MAG: substrate-binding domain-containing protein [Opitutaceae bacterium]